MRATPIARPLPNEHVVAVWPLPGADARDHWNRRLNLFPGRALSDAALTSEQAARAGRLATFGQTRSAGVVQGLEVSIERDAADRPRYFYRINAGQGLTVSGEDVSVPCEQRINVLDVPVCAPAHMFEMESGGPPPTHSGALLARRVGVTLGNLIEQRDQFDAAQLPELPRVGVLLLQPVTLEFVGENNPDDTCERDVSNDAFEDWQLVDGTRLVWFAWPTEWKSLPRLDRRRRNQIAHDIFTAEQQLGPDEMMPWDAYGVPIGVVGFNRQWKPLYFDRNAVVRDGGCWRERTTVVKGPSCALARARFKQFVEQIADAQSSDPARLARELRWLPPIGILPRNAVDPRERVDHFFPSSWRTEATPFPIEELDAVLQPSAALAPFDLFARDEVEVVVPVPLQWYEPELLIREVVDPIFQSTIDRFVIRRGHWLRRRLDLRSKLTAIDKALGNAPLVFPLPDPEASDETEFVSPTAIDTNDPELANSELDFGTTLSGDGVLISAELDKLRAELNNNSPLRGNVSRAYFPPGKPFPAEVDRLPTTLRARLSREGGTRPFIQFTDEMSEADKVAFSRAGASDPEFVAAVETLFQRSHQDEIIELDRKGLKEFIDWLTHRVDAADDCVDFAFARVHTDIYRIRQNILGNEAATRLATSPALAMIAQGESARATQADLQAFVKNLKTQTQAPIAVAAEAPAAAPAPPVAIAVAAAPAAPAGALARAVAAPIRVASLATLRVSSDRGSATATTTDVGRFATAGTVGAALAGVSINASVAGGISANALRATVDSARVLPPVPTRADTEAITAQSPIVGKALNFRTVSVAERLQQPIAPETKDFGVSNKADLLRALTELDINVDDIEVPGFLRYKPDGTLDTDLIAVPNANKTIARTKERRYSILEIAGRGLVREVLEEKHDLDPADGDEGAFFAAGVRSLDNVVAMLRLIEGRILSYRKAIDTCRQTYETIKGQRQALGNRLEVVATGLAEARQDVSVARALFDEERRRVGAINKRRDQIIADHVPYIAFRRPRTVEALVEAPAHRIDPGIVEAALPTALAEDVDIPPGLTQMVSHLADAPSSWFRYVYPLIDRIDQHHVLVQALQYAKVRATVHHDALLALRASNDALLLEHDSVRRVLTARQEVASRARSLTAQMDLSDVASLSWAHVRDRALNALSIGDLADGAHGRADVARAAAQELEYIGHVGGSLYKRFGEVRPAVRLGWAEQLGQYDDAVSLRNLSVLPHWGEIELLDRREMQALVDWLYSRVEPTNTDANSLISDFVRLCILLASHAPVDRIVTARIEQPTTVQPGARLQIAVDTITARIGMHVLVYAAPSINDGTRSVVARGVIEDLGGGRAAAHIVETASPSVNLATSSVVHLISPASRMAAFTPLQLR